MSIKSINEPEGPGRTSMITPASINEPPAPPTGEQVPTPVIEGLEPFNATIGDESFTLYVHGTGFSKLSIIEFAGNDEPTTLEDDGTVSTGINMPLWQGPDTVSVVVKNFDLRSEPAAFTFNPAAEAGTTKHRGTPTKTLPTKRK